MPTLAIEFTQETLAIGSKDNAAHQAKFEVKVTDDGTPLSSVEVPTPTIVEGTGRDPYQGTSASVTMDSNVTDANGIVKGKMTSGNRLEETRIQIQTDPNDPDSGPSAGANQVWNELGDDGLRRILRLRREFDHQLPHGLYP